MKQGKLLRRLAGQTVIYGISSIVARLLNYLLTPYLTYFVMTSEEYGVVTDIYALIPFALVVLTLGMESGYFRFAGNAADEAGRRKVFATTWGTTSATALLFMCAVLPFNARIAGAMGYSAHPSYIWLTASIIALDVITAIPFARLRQQNRALRFVAVRIGSVAINLILCLFFYNILPRLAAVGILESIWSPEFGAGYLLAANLAASLFSLLVLLPSCDGVLPRIDGKLFKRILLYSLPLLIGGIAGTANEFIDRQMIKYLLPEETALGQLGLYGAVVKIGVVMLLFTQMYRMAAEPFFLSGFGKEDFKAVNAEALKYFMIVSVTIFLGISLFSGLFAYIVGPDFREGIRILPVVLVSNILSGAVLNLSFWYKQERRTGFAIIVTGTGLVFTIIFNILLVPKLGYVGAAWARLICEGVMAALSYLLNRRYYPTPYDLRRIGEYLLLGAALYCASLFTSRLPGIAMYVLNGAMVAFFILYALRRERIDLRGIIRIRQI